MPYGGIHTLFCGDPFQFGPIGDDPLYKPSKVEELNKYNSTFNSKVKQRIINSTFGRYLWTLLTHCVILTQPMRQQHDLEYANLIRRVKYGQGTISDYQLLQTRIYGHPLYKKFHTDIDKSKIIFSRNSIRAQTNTLMINSFCKRNQKIKITNYSKDNWINKDQSSNSGIDLMVK